MNPHQVIEVFRRSGTVSELTAEELLNEAVNTGRPIDDIMVEQGIVTEEAFAQTIALDPGVEAVDLASFEPLPALLHLVPSGMARLNEVIPVTASGNVLTVALGNPLDTRPLTTSATRSTARSSRWWLRATRVEKLIATHYGTEETSMEDVLKQLGETEVPGP